MGAWNTVRRTHDQEGAYVATDLARLEELLTSMAPRARIALLLRLEVPADLVMGVDDCYEHVYGRKMYDTEPLAFDGTAVWCKGCYTWWRIGTWH